jgi:hypothetical protein
MKMANQFQALTPPVIREIRARRVRVIRVVFLLLLFGFQQKRPEHSPGRRLSLCWCLLAETGDQSGKE